MSSPTTTRHVPLLWILGALVFGSLLALSSLWSPMLLASWCAHVVRPLHAWLSTRVGGRSRSAAVLTVVCALFVLVPLLVLVLSLFGSANDLLDQLRGSKDWNDAVSRFLSGSSKVSLADADPRGIMTLLQRHGASALGAATTLFGAATTFALFMLVFIACFYSFLVEGRQLYHWMLTYLPIRPGHTDRFTAAFFETGRGLLISFGLTALIQATILSMGYVLIGVPQPLVLGLLTLVASFIPVLGTGLVWAPVAVVLLFVGQTQAGVWALVVGTVVSTLDNLIRPALSRFGKLQLPTVVVLLAMLGGAAAFGPGGLLLGPLLLRLAIEALKIWRDEREFPAGVLPLPMSRPLRHGAGP